MNQSKPSMKSSKSSISSKFSNSRIIVIVLLAMSLTAPGIHVQAETDTFTVSQSSDSVYVRRLPADYGTSILACGDYASNMYDYESGMRWEVDIPRGSTIESAYFKIVADTRYNLIPETILHGEDNDDPVTFVDYADYIARDRTSEFISWKPSAWTNGVTYTSGDISNIIQEIVDRPGFENHIVLFWSHEIGWGGVNNLISGASYEHASYAPPKLVVTWTPPVIYPPSDPDLLFGAGFNATSPYVELHWNHSLVDVQFFEIQNSSDAESWTYLGQSTTANYTDSQVANGTERYYRVRACNQTGGTWYNSSWADVNFEIVYFIPDTEPPPSINIPQVDAIEFNTTIAGNICGVTSVFEDVEGLSGYIFWNNSTSPPGGVNSSWTSLTGTSDSARENITLPSHGVKLGVKYYVNDTDGNWAVDTLIIFPTAQEFIEQINYPYIVSITLNSTQYGNETSVTGVFEDVEGLSGYIFWSNATSPPGGVNSSWTSLNGKTKATEIITMPGADVIVGVGYYLNDTDNNWAFEPRFVFPTSEVGFDFVCDIKEFNISSVDVVVGTLTDGNLASTYSVDGDWYNVSETAGAPGLDVRFNFTDVDEGPELSSVEFYHLYLGNAQHHVEIQAWNFTSGLWRQMGVIMFNETAGWEHLGLGYTPSDFLKDGEVWARFYHEDSGHSAHELCIDALELRIVYAEEGPPAPKVEDYSIIFLAIGLILMLAIAFLYCKGK